MKLPGSNRTAGVQFRMTALIDMAFLLITFFVMSIRFGQAGEEELKLPKADQAREVTQAGVQLITVNIRADGVFKLNGTVVGTETLRRYLQGKIDGSGADKIEVVVRADRTVPFRSVQKAMRLSAEAGVKDVSLAALQLGGGSDSPDAGNPGSGS